MKITFLGAADTVTGSRFLPEFGEYCRSVDSGLFRGGREVSALNHAILTVVTEEH